MTTSMVMDMDLCENSGSKGTVNNGGGRRESKATELTQKKNKQPQRGIGVEQLERLLLQQRWKKMTEIPSLHSLPIPSLNPSVTFTTSSSVFRQPHAPSHNPSMFLPTIGMSGQSPFYSDQFIDPSVIGSSNGGFRFEKSKEVTSIPNYIKCTSDGCGVGHKKKRINGGGSNGCQVNQFRNVVRNNAVVEIDAGKTHRCSGQVREVMRNGVSAMTEYEFTPVKGGGAETAAAAAAWCVGGRSSVGGMMGLRGGVGSCVTGVPGNEQGCTVDLSPKL